MKPYKKNFKTVLKSKVILIRKHEKLTGCLIPVLENCITFIFSILLRYFSKNVKLDLLAPIFTCDD